MRIIEEEQLDFDDVLIMPRRSSLNSRNEVNIFREFKFARKPAEEGGGCRTLNGIPVMGSNMGPIATPKMAKLFAKAGFFSALEKHISLEDLRHLYFDLLQMEQADGVGTGTYCQHVFPCIGIKESTSVLRDLVKTQFGGLDEGATPVFGVNIDVPNGYCPKLIDRVKEIRELLPDGFISAGVVVTPDMCQDIINAGADAVRVGIGSGQQCLTRLKTGVGRPQFSTIVECADACHQMNAYCICDGGCSTPGDICKALCAGADIVMCGSIFGGADETDAEEKMVNGKKYKQFFGMSSHLAQEKYFGGMASYRTSEGREKWIPGTGPLENTLNDITGGLRSCGTYIGARTIKNFSRQAAFYKVRRLVNANFANCADI